jgi:hypothetical protein
VAKRIRAVVVAASPALEVTPRDFVMARLAAARLSLQAAMDAVDETLALYVEPEDDEDGKDRKESLSIALECAGAGSRALESAEQHQDRVDLLEIEPWEDE